MSGYHTILVCEDKFHQTLKLYKIKYKHYVSYKGKSFLPGVNQVSIKKGWFHLISHSRRQPEIFIQKKTPFKRTTTSWKTSPFQRTTQFQRTTWYWRTILEDHPLFRRTTTVGNIFISENNPILEDNLKFEYHPYFVGQPHFGGHPYFSVVKPHFGG